MQEALSLLGISIQGEGDSTACAVVNQLWAWLFTNNKKYFSNHQQPILQLVDDCISGIVTFPVYRDFPGFLEKTTIWDYNLASLHLKIQIEFLSQFQIHVSAVKQIPAPQQVLSIFNSRPTFLFFTFWLKIVFQARYTLCVGFWVFMFSGFWVFGFFLDAKKVQKKS